MIRLLSLAGMLLALIAVQAHAARPDPDREISRLARRNTPPLPTPAHYTSHNYGIDLSLPSGLVYCPQPADAVTSDHGRMLFMADMPQSCGRTWAGQPAPSLDLFYSFDDPYSSQRPQGCPGHWLNEISFAGAKTRVCRKAMEQGHVILWVQAHYRLDDRDVTVTLALATLPERLKHDRALFETVAAGLTLCRPEWAHGPAPACPANGWW